MKNNNILLKIIKRILYVGIIFLIFLNTRVYGQKVENTTYENWTLKIKNGETIILNNNEERNVNVNYNTIMVDMYKVLKYFGDVYGIDTNSLNDTTDYLKYSNILEKISELNFNTKETNIETNENGYLTNNELYFGYREGNFNDNYNLISIKNNKTITVPDFYYYVKSKNKKDHVLINDSVTLDIEEKNGKYYLPLYFFTNIPGVAVYVDGKQVYESSNYLKSMNAINKDVNHHELEIVITKIENDNYASIKNNKRDAYYYNGEEDGALWREEALKRIEKNKKSQINILVEDENGNKINDAQINIEMKKNDFLFGTSIPTIPNYGVWYGEGKNKVSDTLFNATRGMQVFRNPLEKEHGMYRRDYITGIRNLNIPYTRGHWLFWDRNEGILKDVVTGSNNKNPDVELTMYSVYQRYVDLINSGKSEKQAIQETEPYVERLKEKLKNVLMSWVDEMMTDGVYKTIDDWDLFNEPYTSKFFQYLLFEKDESGKAVFLNGKVKDLLNNSSNAKDIEFWKIGNYKPYDYVSEVITPTGEYAEFLASIIEKIRNEYDYKGILTLNQNITTIFSVTNRRIK